MVDIKCLLSFINKMDEERPIWVGSHRSSILFAALEYGVGAQIINAHQIGPIWRVNGLTTHGQAILAATPRHSPGCMCARTSSSTTSENSVRIVS